MPETQQAERKTIPVAVLGATGAVGQRFVQLLDGHPWFEVVALTGPDRAVGQKYGEACHWVLADPMPAWAKDLTLSATLPNPVEAPLAFSALPASAAYEAELAYAQNGTYVCSNASAHRMDPDVPLLLPEVNPDHTELIRRQKQNRSSRGAILTNPNCTITGMTVALRPLQLSFGIQGAYVVSLQAISGAGYPGVASLDILGNVIPYIDGEEQKMEQEPSKMLGRLLDGKIEPTGFPISTQANRVPVAEGHLVCLSVKLGTQASLEDVAQALSSYQAPAISRGLPSTPRPVIELRSEPDRPQPRLDVMSGEGMTTVVGRLRPDPLLDYKMVILSHNTIRGAAGGSIYNAELIVEQGFLSP